MIKFADEVLSTNTPGNNRLLEKDSILEWSETIFKEFFGNFKYNHNYISPLRCNDTHASFRIFKNKNNGLPWFKDYGGIHGNAIDFISNLENIDFYNAMAFINNRLNLKMRYNTNSVLPWINNIVGEVRVKQMSTIPERSEFEINILWNKDRNGNYTYTVVDYNYLAKMFIPIDLAFEHKLISVEKAYRNSCLIAEYSNVNPLYAYLFNLDGRYYTKLYRPFEKIGWKFYSDMIDKSNQILYGYEQLPKHVSNLILTKSGKDVLACKVLGFWAVGTQGEDIYPTDEILFDLERRADYLTIFFDNDWNKKRNKGVEFAIKFYNHMVNLFGSSIKSKLKCIIIPDVYQCTDISDVLYKYHDYYGAKHLLNTLVWKK